MSGSRSMDSWNEEIFSYSWLLRKLEGYNCMIYNHDGQDSISWEKLMQVKGIMERRIKWEWFKKYIKEKYLFARYYDRKKERVQWTKIRIDVNGRACRYVFGIVEVCRLHQGRKSKDLNLRCKFSPMLQILDWVS